jgi:VIT1/CCC1 family predicted Fe2+/Mn2+ transporter
MTPLLAAISGDTLIWAIVQIIIAAVIYFILNWGIAKIGVPEPFNKVLQVILVLLVCLFLINALLTIGGHPLVRWP